MEDSFTREIDEVLEHFQTHPKKGLTTDQVEKYRSRWGLNDIPPPERTSWFTLILKQFEDLLVIILLGAAVISFVLGMLEKEGSWTEALIEPLVIMLILIANAIVGVWQESNAEAAIERLKEYEAKIARVIRDGHESEIDRTFLVPGDLIRLTVGDKVPADSRICSIDSSSFKTDESMLTGESIAQDKIVTPLIGKRIDDVVDQDKKNVTFSGSLVVRGRAKAIVVLTGIDTSMGKIQRGLTQEEEVKTPLGQKLDDFAELLSKIILGICILVWLVNIQHFSDPDHGGYIQGAIYYFKIAVALAVAAIPEGLPAVVTTCLALGTMKMAKRKAIVRSLPSVETLGCTTVICSDKTGTLTTNQMSVQHVMTVAGVESRTRSGKSPTGIEVSEFEIEGDSFKPIGSVRDKTTGETLKLPASRPSMSKISQISCLCNESHLTYGVKEGKPQWGMSGEATEAALKVLAEKLLTPDAEESLKISNSTDDKTRLKAVSSYWNERFEREFLLDFSRDRKSMSVFVRDKRSKQGYLLVKGAPETILSRSTKVFANDGTIVDLSKPVLAEIEKYVHKYSEKGLRVLGMSYVEYGDKGIDNDCKEENYEKIESGMTFVGLVGMLDPPRSEVRDSILRCNQAGIRVIVITGDNQKTAEAICRRIGIFEDDEVLEGKSFKGIEFVRMSPEKQDSVVKTASLFSRVEPDHKYKLVQLLQKHQEVVAMTGDGVNDAPALKKADIGVGMGSGTAVAREASDMVLQDDNFATIVGAVEEGRAIYANTKQFIRYLISSNIGEVACIFLTALLGLPEALIPVQLLWVNLVTDGLPATALGFNKPDSDIMSKPPRGRKDAIIDTWLFIRYMLIGLYIGFGTIAGFLYWFMYFDQGPKISYEQLTHFHSCGGQSEYAQSLFPKDFDCSMFANNHPSTVSLSILVTIEMFNTFNALSENQSLLTMPPWTNMFVILAVALSMLLHCMILYFEFFRNIFQTAASTWEEWMIVLIISVPVILLDEVMKFVSRQRAVSSDQSSKKQN